MGAFDSPLDNVIHGIVDLSGAIRDLKEGQIKLYPELYKELDEMAKAADRLFDHAYRIRLTGR